MNGEYKDALVFAEKPYSDYLEKLYNNMEIISKGPKGLSFA